MENNLNRMNFSKQPKMSLAEVKEIIDRVHLGTYTSKDWIDGGGRDVLFLDDYVVKFPKEQGNVLFDGNMQNMKELEVWFSTKNRNLVPIYGTHLGAIICKRVCECDEVIKDVYGIDNIEMEAIIKRKVNDMRETLERFNLHTGDLLKLNNWGFDDELNDLVCLDYGLSMPSDNVYLELIKDLSDDELLKAFEVACALIDNLIKVREDFSLGKSSDAKNIEKIFKTDIIPFTGARVINRLALSRNIAKQKFYTIDKLKEIVIKEFPNSAVYENKKELKGHNESVYVEHLGFSIYTYKMEYLDFMKSCIKRLYEYHVNRCILK